jgi:opacity protein-like surface antigen
VSADFVSWIFPGCIAMLLGLGISTSALAQSGLTKAPVPAPVPQSGFYGGLGGSYNSANFGVQHVYAVGTSDVYDGDTLVQYGSADGPPAPVFMDPRSSLAPSFQGGYFRHFENSKWLWGAKFSYSYLNITSTTRNAIIPQTGSFTTVQGGAVTPFTGNAYIDYSQTTVRHQMAFMPFIGQSFERIFVYVGVGPTLSQLRTDENGLIGFADINGTHTNVSGAAQNFSGTKWVYGGAATVGATYFFDRSWFLDINYTYGMTRNHTVNFSGTFANPNGPNDTHLTGTLVGNSTWKVITQGVAVTINRLF